MLRRLYLITSLMAVAISLAGIMGVANLITDLPDCVSFAGDKAIKRDQSTVKLTYLKAVGELGQIIYAESMDSGLHYETTIVDTDTLADYVGAPVITVNYSDIFIVFSRDGKTYSVNNGTVSGEFTPEPILVSEFPDPYPVLDFDTSYNAIVYRDVADSVLVDLSTSISSHSLGADGTPVYYSGPSEYWAKIHSNDDIWIKQEGGGNNGGWPVFHSLVTTSGIIRYLSPNPPVAQIFLAGFQQNVPVKPIHAEIADYAIEVGNFVSGNSWSSKAISFVTVNGNMFNTIVGNVFESSPDTTDVWNHYPPRGGNYLFRNRYIRRDTLWSGEYDGNASGINYVNGDLWIKGSFSGRQTWAATGDIYIIGDITLASTPVGESPENNTTDYVVLVSKKQIMLKYGYDDPYDSLRCHPNLGDTYIYASLMAFGDGGDNPGQDGCFTFEYQYPHPSVPAVRIIPNNFVWDKIDLHRYRFPQTTADLWQPEIDYPWYNPLWPERSPYLERGNVHLYGSLFQRRQGAMHLPLSQSNNPTNVWDMENNQYGGPCGEVVQDSILGISLQAQNYPGALGDGIGYRKVLMPGDIRLEGLSLFDAISGGGIIIMDYSPRQICWLWHLNIFSDSTQRYKTSRNKKIAFNNHIYNIQYLYYPNYNYPSGFTDTVLPPGTIRQISTPSYQQHLLAKHVSITGDTLSVYNVNTINQSFELLWQQRTDNRLSCLSENWLYLAAMQPDGRIFFYLYDSQAAIPFPLYNTWDPRINGLDVSIIDNEQSCMTLLSSPTTMVSVVFIKNIGESTGAFYWAVGYIDNVVNEDNLQPVNVSLSVYPNPFSSSLTLEVSTDKQTEADLSIYNLKGQKVRTLATDHLLSKGSQEFTWDGLDSNGNSTASGIYFLKSKIAGKSKLTKLLKIR